VVAADRDKFASKLDKRFDAIAYALQVYGSGAISRLCDYIQMREAEPDKTLGAMFREADRVLTRGAAPLFDDHDPEADRIRARGRDSHSASRLAAAFDDSRRNGGDLALALARRQVRWVEGCLATQKDWPEARASFRDVSRGTISELARRHRERYLGIGDRVPRRRTAVDQTAILAERIPVRP
jgi:hypothetical protein